VREDASRKQGHSNTATERVIRVTERKGPETRVAAAANSSSRSRYYRLKLRTIAKAKAGKSRAARENSWWPKAWGKKPGKKKPPPSDQKELTSETPGQANSLHSFPTNRGDPRRGPLMETPCSTSLEPLFPENSENKC
jgi:hypothetical protein